MKRILAGGILIAAFALPSFPLLAAGDKPESEGWTEVSRTPQLTVYNRKKKDSAINELKAVGLFEAPPSVVNNVLHDIADYPDFMPYVAEVHVIRREKDSTLTYQRLSMPLVSDRDYTIRVFNEMRPCAEGGTTIVNRWESANEFGPPVKPGVVRVKTNEGSWMLEPIDGGKRTRATYSVYTDPGGGIPSFLTNSANTRVIPTLFEAVGKTALKPKYREKAPVPATF